MILQRSRRVYASALKKGTEEPVHGVMTEKTSSYVKLITEDGKVTCEPDYVPLPLALLSEDLQEFARRMGVTKNNYITSH